MPQINKSWWLFLLLLLPLLAALLTHHFSYWILLMYVFLSASLTVLLISVQQQNVWLRRLLKTLLIVFYFAFVFMLLFEAILFDFTGRGFTNEVYFHFELESLRIGFHEYPGQLLAFMFLVIVYIFMINKLLKRPLRPANLLITVIAMLILITVTINSSLARFVNGFGDYSWQVPMTVDKALINQYIDLGVLQNDVITIKSELKASSSKSSKNLILLYLESFNEGLLHLDQYPNLTPNLNELSHNYQNLNHISSSYVTIAGIISSQCGTMLPMTAGNNTFLTEGQLLFKMPCLGDVLKQAGYTQYYLGGAQMDFAGKGRFLETHGYDYIWGLEHWKAQGLRETKGIWGLSDSQLFKNAIDTIKVAAKNPPYNLTLLTLGTHIPGYTYAECQPYSGSDEAFIDAIHCTDQLVGRFVKELENNQMLDNTLLMIVADHGVFPSVKMRELFADEVDNRKLIGITNYQPLSDNQLSSYDLTPTILDMLKINHNAKFLFGQSLFNVNKNKQKYVTRTKDWQGEKMVPNPVGECDEKEILNWPLNQCYKQKLIGLTNSLLETYSTKDQPEPLSCSLDIGFEPTKNNPVQRSLWLNEVNHFEHFYHKGHLLKTLKITSGVFVFILNNEKAIEKHIFFEDDEISLAYIDKLVQITVNPVLIIKAKIHPNDSDPLIEETSIQTEYYQQQIKLWSKNTKSSFIEDLDLCQADQSN